jgi:dTDP-glucose 4,6-dehydratase
MKVLVTGGAGFIGSNFIHYWMKTHPEDTIINLDKLTYAGNLENLKSIQDNPNYSFLHGDICDPEIVAKAMDGVDTVVHFAAESHNDRANVERHKTVMTNVIGTQVLLDAALAKKVKRFHHIGTDEVFGHIELDESRKFTERTNYEPRSVYPASKAGADHLVRAYNIAYGLPVTITNCSNNFGPYQFPEKLIPLAITNVIEGKKIPIYGDGLYVRDWLYVEDHCRAIDLVLQKGKIGETYLVGGMTDLAPNIEIAKKILKLLGKNEDFIEYVKDRPGHDRKYDVDWSKIKNELRWKPQYGFDEWLAKTVKWYEDNTEWWQRIKSGEYKEYYEKQYNNR